MNRGRMTFFFVSAALVVTLLSGTLLGAVTKDEPTGEDSLYKYLSVFTEVLSLIRQAYVDSPEIGELMLGALDGTTDALDPFSMYVPPGQVEAYLAASATVEQLTGLTILKERGVAYAVSVAPGSPAEDAGLRMNDLISKVNGELTRELPLWKVQQMLGGEAGSQVEVEVIRRGDTHALTIALEAFETAPVEFAEQDGEQIVRIFSPQAAAEAPLRDFLENFEGDRLLVDLRRSAGGDANVAYRLADLFARGELGKLVRKDEDLVSFAGRDEVVWQGRMVVLVSRGTLGPSEILATVLRQKAGAELVGDRTFGWAGQRDSSALASGGSLFYTSAFYTGPDGEPLSSSLEPDVRVRPGTAGFSAGETDFEDLILQRGIERLKDDEPLESTEQKAA
ncbi:MAG: S41 family peptidase [Acidobacteriota bacterium]